MSLVAATLVCLESQDDAQQGQAVLKLQNGDDAQGHALEEIPSSLPVQQFPWTAPISINLCGSIVENWAGQCALGCVCLMSVLPLNYLVEFLCFLLVQRNIGDVSFNLQVLDLILQKGTTVLSISAWPHVCWTCCCFDFHPQESLNEGGIVVRNSCISPNRLPNHSLIVQARVLLSFTSGP